MWWCHRQTTRESLTCILLGVLNLGFLLSVLPDKMSVYRILTDSKIRLDKSLPVAGLLLFPTMSLPNKILQVDILTLIRFHSNTPPDR